MRMLGMLLLLTISMASSLHSRCRLLRLVVSSAAPDLFRGVVSCLWLEETPTVMRLEEESRILFRADKDRKLAKALPLPTCAGEAVVLVTPLVGLLLIGFLPGVVAVLLWLLVRC